MKNIDIEQTEKKEKVYNPHGRNNGQGNAL